MIQTKLSFSSGIISCRFDDWVLITEVACFGDLGLYDFEVSFLSYFGGDVTNLFLGAVKTEMLIFSLENSLFLETSDKRCSLSLFSSHMVGVVSIGQSLLVIGGPTASLRRHKSFRISHLRIRLGDKVHVRRLLEHNLAGNIFLSIILLVNVFGLRLLLLALRKHEALILILSVEIHTVYENSVVSRDLFVFCTMPRVWTPNHNIFCNSSIGS